MHDGWFINPGERPTKWPATTPILVEWSNGRLSRKSYRIDQLVWEIRGWDFDIAKFRRV